MGVTVTLSGENCVHPLLRNTRTVEGVVVVDAVANNSVRGHMAPKSSPNRMLAEEMRGYWVVLKSFQNSVGAEAGVGAVGSVAVILGGTSGVLLFTEGET
jgi:hypothetical protein